MWKLLERFYMSFAFRALWDSPGKLEGIRMSGISSTACYRTHPEKGWIMMGYDISEPNLSCPPHPILTCRVTVVKCLLYSRSQCFSKHNQRVNSKSSKGCKTNQQLKKRKQNKSVFTKMEKTKSAQDESMLVDLSSNFPRIFCFFGIC